MTAQFKMVNGELVELTQAEIDQRNTEAAASQAQAVTERIKSYRREIENGGITVNGVDIQTDVESRASLLGAVQLNRNIDWKTRKGFVSVSPAQVSALATAVGDHVQKCFTAEKVVSEAHAAKPYETIEDVEAAFDAAYAN